MKSPIDFINEQHYKATRLQIFLVWVSLGLCACLAPWYNTWLEWGAIGVPAAIVPTILFKIMPVNRVTRVSIGMSYMVFAALMMHQGHGVTELHFAVFGYLAFCLFLRDWMPIMAGTLLIAVHHVIFPYLQYKGIGGIYVFAGNVGVERVLVHAAYLMFEAVILLYMAKVLEKESVQNAESKAIAQYLKVRDGKIELNFTEEEAKSNFGNDFGPFFSTLRNAILVVKSGSDSLVNSSREVAVGNENISIKTDEQMVAITAITDNMQQISEAISINANYAQEAEDLAEKASNKAADGVAIVTDTIEAMGEIMESSKSISTFIETIEEISFQTNLLALNASIEAAHAGEMGRGFAVVAEEVRGLAERSSEASRSSRELIENSLGRVQRGSELVDTAGSTLCDISGSFEELSALVTKMSMEGKKQRHSIHEVNSSIEDMNGINQSNVALIKKVADSSATMLIDTRSLIDQVSCFDLRNGT